MEVWSSWITYILSADAFKAKITRIFSV